MDPISFMTRSSGHQCDLAEISCEKFQLSLHIDDPAFPGAKADDDNFEDIIGHSLHGAVECGDFLNDWGDEITCHERTFGSFCHNFVF